ncbi:MAG: hypothetical protein ACYC96_00825 [Fimbriimonadaceae bacterium]
MSQREIATIVCPKCKNNLPAWSQICQFCGTALPGAGRPTGGPIVDTWNDRPTWQEVCYIIVSVIFILIGALEILQGFHVIAAGTGSNVTAGVGTYLQIMGTLSVVLGIGMLFQQLWAQFIVKWYSVLALVVALWNLLFSSMGASDIAKVVPASTVALMILTNAAYVALYAFTIYIIKVVGDVDP